MVRGFLAMVRIREAGVAAKQAVPPGWLAVIVAVSAANRKAVSLEMRTAEVLALS